MSEADQNKRLPSTAVCERYGISRRTLARWMEDTKLAFPEPTATINGRHYFSEIALVEWERSRCARQAA